MNEVRSRHLVERAASRLRDEFGLQPGATSPPPAAQTVAQPAAQPVAQPAASRPGSLAPAPPAALHTQGMIESVAPRTAEPPPPHPGSAGAVLSMEAMQRAGLTLGGRSRSRITEEFSVSAGALLRGLRGRGRNPADAGEGAAAFGNLLLVTSAKPGEGKTFSALNLAATMAHNGLARVVLADIDSKVDSLTARLGLDGRQGLFDIAADPSLKPEAILVGTAVRDLSVLPLGTREAVPGGHGLARKITTAIERVARRLSGQVIVLDASPCLATSEPAALAPVVGLVAMVVEAERTQRSEVEAALEMVATCQNVMLVLNKIRDGRAHTFGYYDYYGS